MFKMTACRAQLLVLHLMKSLNGVVISRVSDTFELSEHLSTQPSSLKNTNVETVYLTNLEGEDYL